MAYISRDLETRYCTHLHFISILPETKLSYIIKYFNVMDIEYIFRIGFKIQVNNII